MTNESSKSNQVIVHEILDEFKRRGYDNFTPRPWNYHRPETTLWWLVPSTLWPSYKYGKIVVFREKGKYQVGLHVEKGISEVAGTMHSRNSAEKLCIKSDWIWNSFLENYRKGKLKDSLESIAEIIQKPLRIVIQASDINSKDSSNDDFEDLEKDNIISFEYKDGQFICLHDEITGEMRKYDYIKNFEELSEIFEAKDMEWFWIDLFILFELETTDIKDSSNIAVHIIQEFSEMFEKR